MIDTEGALEKVALIGPDTIWTLVPFFNVMDVAARDGNIWLYGEANGEVMDTGTVPMGFDATLQMFLQRHYVTENHVFRRVRSNSRRPGLWATRGQAKQSRRVHVRVRTTRRAAVG